MLYTVANSLSVVLIARSVNAAVGGQPLSPAQENQLLLFLAIGTLVWHYLAVVFEVVSEMISWERWEGTIEYTFMAPVRRSTHMIGTTMFSIVYGLVHTAVMLLVIVVVFDLDMGRANLRRPRRCCWRAACLSWASASWAPCCRCCSQSGAPR